MKVFIQEITHCDESCPNFSMGTYKSQCMAGGTAPNGRVAIPEDCPLKDVDLDDPKTATITVDDL